MAPAGALTPDTPTHHRSTEMVASCFFQDHTFSRSHNCQRFCFNATSALTVDRVVPVRCFGIGALRPQRRVAVRLLCERPAKTGTRLVAGTTETQGTMHLSPRARWTSGEASHGSRSPTSLGPCVACMWMRHAARPTFAHSNPATRHMCECPLGQRGMRADARRGQPYRREQAHVPEEDGSE